jgi:hypothetical protein
MLGHSALLIVPYNVAQLVTLFIEISRDASISGQVLHCSAEQCSYVLLISRALQCSTVPVH